MNSADDQNPTPENACPEAGGAPCSGATDGRDQVALARRAADGDSAARRRVNELVHPIISCQTHRFCRRFCRGNQRRYACTLQPPLSGGPPRGALLCEFGNASYAWMLDDLTHQRRLLRFQGRNGARLYDYLYSIANSLPFYERWKDWRFGRRVHVPTYIREMGPLAAKVFMELRASSTVADIAQKLRRSEPEVEQLSHTIIVALTRRSRLHLLNPPRTVSLSEPEGDRRGAADHRHHERDIPVHDEPLEDREARQKLKRAWERLTALEQFVLEAMLIDGEDAAQVLAVLRRVGVSVKKGVRPEDLNRQQLYYFRRKAFSKLSDLMAAG
jgi:hypothetical protein